MINMEFFNKLSNKEKIGLVAAAIFVGLVLIDRTVISPISEKMRRVDRDIKFAETKLSRDLRNINNRDLIEKEYDRYRNYIKRSYASDEETVAGILADIEDRARSSGVSLVDIRPEQPRSADFYKEYAVEIEAEGGMDQVVTFLHHLNSSPQLLRAVKLRLGLKDPESSVVRASFRVTKITL